MTGEERGVARELAVAFAQRLGVPIEIVVHANNAEALEAVRSGRADFGFTNATAARAKDMDFSPALLAVEQGYLVPAGSAIEDAQEVDRPGRSVGVTKGSTSERVLAKQLGAAKVVTLPSIADAREALAKGQIDAFATNKPILFEVHDRLPGSRVLSGRWGTENFAIAVPKGREAGHAELADFVARARAGGLVKAASGRAGLRGTAEPAAN